MEKSDFIGRLDTIVGALKAQAVAAISCNHAVCPVTVDGLSELLSDIRDDLLPVWEKLNPVRNESVASQAREYLDGQGIERPAA